MSVFDASFFKRLGFYMVGLSIGLVFLAFVFKKKGTTFCYLPNCRTLKDMRSKPISYSEEINELLRTKKLDSATIIAFFNDGDVDFGRSDTKSANCKTYFIEGEVDQKEAVLQVRNCRGKVLVQDLVE